MKNVEMVSKTIHEKIMTNPMVNWYRVSEIDNEVYEINFYVNFIVDDVNGMKEFEYDIQELVKAIEDNTLIKIGDKYHLLVINDVDVIEESTLVITSICEKIQK